MILTIPHVIHTLHAFAAKFMCIVIGEIFVCKFNTLRPRNVEVKELNEGVESKGGGGRVDKCLSPYPSLCY